MPIQSGTHVGPYEILSAIGAGGMGEVYRARDPKLGRDVAITVLPEAFALNAERMARFQREAKVLASLSHPNIATIYGLEDSGSTRALVMELVEGPTLADRIKAGPIPVDEAVRIARQIADALEYAHERGIIHRDLKPANVKVTNDDAVKVLDFGLAKALEGDPSSIDISTSPTISRMATQQGVLLGTAAYMSPEQAKAKSVDRRADIWAFGCVLYEMLTGKVAFPGDSVTDTLAGVIRAEPDWSLLPAATPMRVRVLLQRCLQKDPKERLQAIGDARIALNEVLSGAPDLAPVGTTQAAIPRRRYALPWVAAAIALGIVAATFAFLYLRERAPTAAEPVRFQIPLPEGVGLAAGGYFSVSPDGRQLAFFSAGSDGVPRVWVRALDSLEARPLSGSESDGTPFFWSFDSRYIVLGASGKLKKIDVSGGPAEVLCDVKGVVVGGSWNRDGLIIFGQNPGVVMRVSANGGSASPVTNVDATVIGQDYPSFLPDGRHFIYRQLKADASKRGVFVGSLDTGGEKNPSRQVLATQFQPAFVSSASGSGQILFVRDGNLMAQPFDVQHLQVSGEPITLAEHVGFVRGTSYFSASPRAIVYRAGGAGGFQPTWFDRQGKILGTAGQVSTILTISLSPDGTRAAVGRLDSSLALWLVDLSRGTNARFTFGPSSALLGTWSPDGSRIIFASNTGGVYDLYQKLASGVRDEELLLKSSENKFPTNWSNDGRFLLYDSVNGTTTKRDLWVLPVEGDKKPFSFLSNSFNNRDGQFSPDGHLIAYTSDESGRYEVYVRTFSPNSTSGSSDTGGKWLISTDGGTDPRWRRDGKELFYVAADGSLMAVEVATNRGFEASVPKALFRAPGQSGLVFRYQWDVTADGNRFLFPAATAQGASPFTVVLNWTSLLKK